MRRVKNELGMPGAMFPSVNRLRKGYGHESFFPLYEEACKLDLPIAIHGAPSRDLGFDFFDRFVEVHALEHPLPLMIQMTNMIFQGVFELFPQLRVAYLEAGAGWVPFMMDRLDEDFERRGKKWAPRLTSGRAITSLAGRSTFPWSRKNELCPMCSNCSARIIFSSRPIIRTNASARSTSTTYPNSKRARILPIRPNEKFLADNARTFYRLTEFTDATGVGF